MIRLVVSNWLDWPLQDQEKTAEHWRQHWQDTIVPDVLSCDVLSLAGERACSALIELGIGLSRGIPIISVSPDWWSFSHLPSVRVFNDLAPAISALIAMAAGERSRPAA